MSNDRLPDHVIVGDAHTHEVPNVEVGALYRVAARTELPPDGDAVPLSEFTFHPVDTPTTDALEALIAQKKATLTGIAPDNYPILWRAEGFMDGVRAAQPKLPESSHKRAK